MNDGGAMHRVFVYGTLRHGGSAAHRMDGGNCLGEGWVEGRLYRIDWYPGLIPDAAGGPVRGEVHEVDDAHLGRLDAYEGPEYRRTMVRVAGQAPCEAWIWEWIGPVDEGRRIHGGDWLEFTGTGLAGQQ